MMNYTLAVDESTYAISVIGGLWVCIQIANMIFKKRGDGDPRDQKLDELLDKTAANGTTLATIQSQLTHQNTMFQEHVLNVEKRFANIGIVIDRHDTILRGDGQVDGLQSRVRRLEDFAIWPEGKRHVIEG